MLLCGLGAGKSIRREWGKAAAGLQQCSSPAEAPAKHLLGSVDSSCTAAGRECGWEEGDQQHEEMAFRLGGY